MAMVRISQKALKRFRSLQRKPRLHTSRSFFIINYFSDGVLTVLSDGVADAGGVLLDGGTDDCNAGNPAFKFANICGTVLSCGFNC